MQNVKSLLIAPLDWGLGHTTRCVPVIRHIRDRGHRVIFAGNEGQRLFITKTFPDIETRHLDGYDVRYSSSQSAFLLTLLSQIPRLLGVIRKEREWLKQLAAAEKIDGIISDNRYGLYHPDIPSVIITHQLQIQTGMGSFADDLLRSQHYSFLNRFERVWVADMKGPVNLGGKLSHPASLPGNTEYLGLLSQLEPVATQEESNEVLILLSGPEPQRSILSKQLWQQACAMEGQRFVFVEGSDDAEGPATIPAHIQYHKRLVQEELQPLMQRAGTVVCRSGYSTLMDLVALQKKAILIPTPGQTEQEYLARQLAERGIFLTSDQKGFELADMIAQASAFNNSTNGLSGAHHSYAPVIDGWLQRV